MGMLFTANADAYIYNEHILSMITLSKSSKENYTAHTVFGVVSLSMVLLLFYIDEGRYSFEGLFAMGYLPPLAFYFASFFAIPTAVFHVIGRSPPQELPAELLHSFLC